MQFSYTSFVLLFFVWLRHGLPSWLRPSILPQHLTPRHSSFDNILVWNLATTLHIRKLFTKTKSENGKNENPSKIEIKTKKIETFESNANLDSKAQSSWTVVHKKVKKSTSESTQLNSHAKFLISLKKKFINLISRVLFQFSSFQLYYLTLPFPKITIDYFRLVWIFGTM